MSRRPIDDAVAAIEAKIAALERQLSLLREAQRLDIEATEMEQDQNHHLPPEHTTRRFGPMQVHSPEKVLGVRIAEGRKKQNPSRKAQLAVGLTDKAVAAMIGEGVTRITVCKWHTGATAIPARHADTLAAIKPVGIPRHVWPKIRN